MSWYSLRQLAKELGMAPNTFKNTIWKSIHQIVSQKPTKGGLHNQLKKLK
ncbi:hypothetical protein OK024_09170 [Acinetobacter sp. UGAL515B_02]|nr:hypothetical protein [Acinetobacter sp. UGAL515B_02]WON81760.1 hypothetical protein OK024_09170 [Acinetobacter sp. UGAL515B_02]